MRVEYSDIDCKEQPNESWEQSRRTFIHNALISSLALSFFSFPSCILADQKWDGKGIFTAHEMNTLFHLQLAILPADGNGPSSEEIRALDYFMWYLTEANTTASDIDYLVNGLKTIVLSINKLASKTATIEHISQEDWKKIIPQLCSTYAHKDWLSKLTTLIFEALLLDPVYGVNVNEIGWEWLEHQPGIPRPTEENKYPIYLHLIYG
jgi:gluconate 2-dehydrogenase gamma chain